MTDVDGTLTEGLSGERPFGRFAGACVVLALFHGGCGDSGGAVTTNGGGSGGVTAGTSGTGTEGGEGGTSAEGGAQPSGGAGNRGGSSGASGRGGSAGAGTGDGTNMPGVLITPESGEIENEDGEVVGDGPEWLLLLSSHYDVYTEDPLLMHWVGLVKNIGPDIVCPGGFTPTFYDDQGAEVRTLFGGLVHAPLYVRSGDDIPRTCVAPGEFAMAAAIDHSNQPPVDVARVTEVGYSVAGVAYSDLSPKEWLALSAATLDDDVVSGTVVNGDDELRSWNLYVFGTVQSDVGKVPLGLQYASKAALAETIPPGDVERFEADPPFHAPVTGFEVYYTVRLP